MEPPLQLRCFYLPLLLVHAIVPSLCADNIQYGLCQQYEDPPIHLAYLELRPWPLVIAANQTIAALAHARILAEIPRNSSVTVTITKETAEAGVSLSIPCRAVPWGEDTFVFLGSCSYDGDTFLNTFLSEFFCVPPVYVEGPED